MKHRLRLLAALNAVLLLSAVGCGDEGGGCGPAPAKEEEKQSGGGGGPTPGGGSGAAPELITSDKRGRVPKPYRRPRSLKEEGTADGAPVKSTATISKPVIPLSPAAQKAALLPVARVVKTRVDGVADRVEIKCRILASSPGGDCTGAANYDEIKERCCPGGLVERCQATNLGITLIGRGCEVAK